MKQTSALHEKIVILSVFTKDYPTVAVDKKNEIRKLGQGFYRMFGYLGFMELPNIPELLSMAKDRGLEIDPKDISYFLGRISLVPSEGRRVLDPLRRFLFGLMQRNAVSPVIYYRIPPGKVLELGVQMEF